jgi:hypothetical protein
MNTLRHPDMEKWRHGDMETWTWRHGDMDVEKKSNEKQTPPDDFL